MTHAIKKLCSFTSENKGNKWAPTIKRVRCPHRNKPNVAKSECSGYQKVTWCIFKPKFSLLDSFTA